MKYNVHLYALVRVRYDGIEAENQQAAIEKAINESFSREDLVSGDYAEGIPQALVDEVGDETYKNSHFYEWKGGADWKQI